MNTSRVRAWQPNPREQKTVRVKVRRKSWITKGEKIIYSFVGICLIAAGVYIVSYSSTTDTLNRDIQTLEKRISEQHIQNENLEFKIKELSKPERIMKIAEKNGLKIQDTKVKRAQRVSE